VLLLSPLQSDEPVAAGRGAASRSGPLCSSCDEPLPNRGRGAALGAGGKLRCAMCTRLHRERQYCRVCERVWHHGAPFDGAQCDGCDFWVHAACDPKMAGVLASLAAGGAAAQYHCPICVRDAAAAAVASKTAAAAAAAAAATAAKVAATAASKAARAVAAVAAHGGSASSALAAALKAETFDPVGGRIPRPKSAWQIFGKHFFARYRDAHPDAPPNFADVYRLQGEAWRALDAGERARYEALSRAEGEAFHARIRQLQASDPGAVLVVGKGDESRFRRIAAEVGCADAVTFAGAHRDGLSRFHAAADVFAMPASFETFSMATLEAMAAGLPVVISDRMGVRDLVRDGENGFVVVTTERVEACGNRLARLLHEGARRAMGDSARRTAQEHAWDRVAAEIIDIYERNLRCNRMKWSELREGVHT
jgi:hypothetical protein